MRPVSSGGSTGVEHHAELLIFNIQSSTDAARGSEGHFRARRHPGCCSHSRRGHADAQFEWKSEAGVVRTIASATSAGSYVSAIDPDRWLSLVIALKSRLSQASLTPVSRRADTYSRARHKAFSTDPVRGFLHDR
jgi:hypothetical protein